MTMKALVLDASYYPVQIIDWKKAMILFFTGRAEVVDYHDDVKVNSTNSSFKLPKVLRLYTKIKKLTRVKFNRSNVFFRDKFICQYCHQKFKAFELTLDHVVPRSKGGGTNWENIVTACHTCNNKKGSKSLQEFNFNLLTKPVEPKWTPSFVFRLNQLERKIFGNWFVSNT